MRILGPDGRPVESGPPVSDDVRKIVEQARAIDAAGDPATALQQMVLAFQSDVSSDLVLDATCDLLAGVMRMTGATQSDELQLFQAIRADRDNAEHYYQVGERFLELGQPMVARPFLARARQLCGGDTSQLTQAIDVSYARVLMDLGAYQEAIDGFHQLNESYGGLPIWLLLDMAECYALTRQLDEAAAVYEIATPDAAAQFDGLEQVREEVGDLIARVHDFDGITEMDLRAWHYVQTRAMLIELNDDPEIPGGRFVFLQPDEGDVASIVCTTAALLDAKQYSPNRILWLGPTSEPLARTFAQWWEIEPANVREYEHGDNTDSEDEVALLVMAHSDDVLTLQDEEAAFDLAQARPGLITFALDLHWTERQFITPDIAGFMAQGATLPWENRLEMSPDGQTATPIEETRDPDTIAQDIARLFPAEQQCDEEARALLGEYTECSDLILDHRDGTLYRRPLVPHSPVQSPRFGF